MAAKKHNYRTSHYIRTFSNMLATLLVILLATVTAFLALVIYTLPAKVQPRKGSVQIVVLGDIGRSPRMQYHALSIVQYGGYVDFIGYQGKQSIFEPKPGIYRPSSLTSDTIKYRVRANCRATVTSGSQVLPSLKPSRDLADSQQDCLHIGWAFESPFPGLGFVDGSGVPDTVLRMGAFAEPTFHTHSTTRHYCMLSTREQVGNRLAQLWLLDPRIEAWR